MKRGFFVLIATIAAVSVLLVSSVTASVTAPSATITIDGTNDFPSATHLSELAFSWPVTGGNATHSDACNETSAFHWTADDTSNQNLSGGNTADVKEFWVTWDANYLYLAVQGPNAMMDTDVVDLFIAIDTNGSTSGDLIQSSTAWGKWVDFDEWTPEFFVAVSQARDISDGNPAGYAELVPVGGSASTLTWGTAWANSGWAAGDNCNVDSNGFYNGGVFFEFRLSWTQLGFTGPPNPTTGGTPMNFAVYTTHNNSGYDVYDSAPGTGNGTAHEQLGDYRGDGDHCGSNADPVVGTSDPTCSHPAGTSDNTLGAGNSVGGRNPGSDNGWNISDPSAREHPDTIGEYFRVLNVGASNQNPLAVTMAAFTADAGANGVTLTWETVSETDNAGFNLYRSTTPLGSDDFSRPSAAWLKLNEALIPSAAPGSSTGHVYTYTDTTVEPGVVYWYWLEDVDLAGGTTLHGPVSATVGEPTAVALSGLSAGGPAPGLPWWAVVAALGLALLAGLGLQSQRQA